MRHLLLSRELSPAPYPPGGIGTYVANIATLLAERGETVHLIGQRWSGAPEPREVRCDGRLIIHRVPDDGPIEGTTEESIRLLRGTPVKTQAWAWNAALLAESLIRDEGIDVIEGQEWEAPLYFLLLRRALGLGPERNPPCIVHLHSPSEFIWRHNDWSLADPFLVTLRRLEEYVIASADALLCPSRYLAGQLAERYGLARDEIEVVPYPIGSLATPAHASDAWANGPVLYLGRIERRKGLVEFIDAAVAVARDDRTVRFEFVGSDVSSPAGESTRTSLTDRIPPTLRHRFHFTDGVSRDALGHLFSTAAFAVIPSRWENFPNTLIEAMHAGVPVLASPSGGMAEVLEDGQSGWIAPSQSAAGLEAALRRALATPPEERATMGQRAADAILRHCANDRVLQAQLEFRERVVRRGASRSLDLPATLPWAGAEMHRERSAASRPTSAPTPIGVGKGRVAGEHRETSALLMAIPDDGAVSLYVRRVAREHPHALVVSLAPGYAGHASGLHLAARAMHAHPEIGIAVGWVDRPEGGMAPPCPAFPFQWLRNETWPVAVFRAEAVLDALPGSEDLREPFAHWHLANAVMARGWRAVTIPAVLARAVTYGVPGTPETDAASAPVGTRELLWSSFPSLLQRDALSLVTLLTSDGAGTITQPLHLHASANATGSMPGRDRWTGISRTDILRMPMRDKVALLRASLRDPGRVMAWVRTRAASRNGSR